jgi:hypothetical protein
MWTVEPLQRQFHGLNRVSGNPFAAGSTKIIRENRMTGKVESGVHRLYIGMKDGKIFIKPWIGTYFVSTGITSRCSEWILFVEVEFTEGLPRKEERGTFIWVPSEHFKTLKRLYEVAVREDLDSLPF